MTGARPGDATQTEREITGAKPAARLAALSEEMRGLDRVNEYGNVLLNRDQLVDGQEIRIAIWRVSTSAEQIAPDEFGNRKRG